MGLLTHGPQPEIEEDEDDDESDSDSEPSAVRTRPTRRVAKGPVQKKSPRTRRASAKEAANLSPSRKKRSELDKLLEAGSSSFHFETAKEATTRTVSNGLGPIHIDVSEHSNSSMEEFVQAKVSTRRRQAPPIKVSTAVR